MLTRPHFRLLLYERRIFLKCSWRQSRPRAAGLGRIGMDSCTLQHEAQTDSERTTKKSTNNADVDATDIFRSQLEDIMTLHYDGGCAPLNSTTLPSSSSFLHGCLSLIQTWSLLWGVTEIIIGNQRELTRQCSSPNPNATTQQITVRRLYWFKWG